MATIAFTGSFDPVHEGHKYIAEQAARLGFTVLVVVANNNEKTYTKELQERMRDVSAFIPNTQVYGCDSNNIGPFITDLGCVAIVRGLRDEKDFCYEQTITEYNRRVNELETIYIPAPPELQNISSSSLKV